MLQVLGGTTNCGSGAFVYETTRVAADTAIARMAVLVEQVVPCTINWSGKSGHPSMTAASSKLNDTGVHRNQRYMGSWIGGFRLPLAKKTKCLESQSIFCRQPPSKAEWNL